MPVLELTLEELEILSMALATEIREDQKWINWHLDPTNDQAGGQVAADNVQGMLDLTVALEKRVNEHWRERELMVTRG